MIFFLHGSIGLPTDWDNIINSLHSFENHAVNLYDYSSEEISKTARKINESARTDDIIIGYSLGARIALQALLEKDSPWSKAVIISGHSGITESKYRNARISHDKEWSELCMNDWPKFINSWEKQSIFNNSKPLENRDSLRPFSNKISETFINWSSGKQSPPINEFDKIKIPTLWLAGELDIKYIKIAEQACNILPHAKLKIIQNSGHRVPWDNPKDTANAINVFIS